MLAFVSYCKEKGLSSESIECKLKNATRSISGIKAIFFREPVGVSVDFPSYINGLI